MPGLRGEAGGAEWEEWGVLGVQQLLEGLSVYVADGAAVTRSAILGRDCAVQWEKRHHDTSWCPFQEEAHNWHYVSTIANQPYVLHSDRYPARGTQTSSQCEEPVTTIDLSDDSLFGNEASEDEADDIFHSYAVERPEVQSFLDEKKQISIIRAYKGEGKSGVLRLIAERLSKRPLPPLVINTTASSVSPEFDSADSDRWVRGWKASLLRLAANEIGANISFAFKDDAISLVEQAENNGFRQRSFVSSIVDRLKTSAIPIERTKPLLVNPEAVLKRWSEAGSEVWFVIDDLDQNFENEKIHKVKIASFFVAIRQICNLIPEFRFRLAIRPNVWATIKRDFEALSHVEQYISDLNWSLDDYYGLLSRRVEGYLKRTGAWDAVEKKLDRNQFQRNRQLIALVFDDPMPWGRDATRPPTTILYTLSRHRPRWVVELGKVSAKSANAARRSKINFEDIDDQLEEFGRKRIDDTIAEFKSQCPQLEDLITAFVGQPERFTTDKLLSIINNRVLQAVSPQISGVLGKPSAREVARFLFQIGFLTARKERPDGGYDHVMFAENPALLGAKTNVDQGHSWEIHPVFRQILKLKNV